MERDGYYMTTSICLGVGLIFVVAYVIPTAKRLQGLFAAPPVCIDHAVADPNGPVTALPLSKWRVAIS